MWAKVQEVIEDIRPLVESVGCHMELVDVLDGVVSLRLTTSEYAAQHDPQRLQEFIERELLGELEELKKITFEQKDPPKVDVPEPVKIDILEPPEETDTCIVTLDRVVSEASAVFDSAAEAEAVPLVQALFAVPGIASIMVKDRMIILGRSGRDRGWPALVADIRATIVSHYGGTPRRRSSGDVDDDKIRVQVEEILEVEINPAVAAHGGTIELVDVTDGVVSLFMGGG